MARDRYGLPRRVCPCWRHRLQWRLIRASVAAGVGRGRAWEARLWLTLAEWC